MASSTAYTIVKVVGAALLVYLGVRMLLVARKRETDKPIIVNQVHTRRRAGSPFWQGFWSNVLNPKVAILFLWLPTSVCRAWRPGLGQDSAAFRNVPGDGPGLAVDLSAMMSRLAGVMGSDAVRRRLEIITGAVLIVLGIRVVTQDL